MRTDTWLTRLFFAAAASLMLAAAALPRGEVFANEVSPADGVIIGDATLGEKCPGTRCTGRKEPLCCSDADASTGVTNYYYFP